jgi:RimJ/RimL family protein N-acetyltransferase
MRSESVYRVYWMAGTQVNGEPRPEKLGEGYTMELWKPGLGALVPPTMSSRFIVWWLFHCCGILGNGMYRALLVRHKGVVVHRSCLVPRYFRWPFMGKNDLQITSTWTSPDHCGLGLATFALRRLVGGCADGSRSFWYISREDNPASIAVCVRSGFAFYCLMERTHPWGSLLFGRFLPIENAEKNCHENLAVDHR